MQINCSCLTNTICVVKFGSQNMPLYLKLSLPQVQILKNMTLYLCQLFVIDCRKINLPHNNIIKQIYLEVTSLMMCKLFSPWKFIYKWKSPSDKLITSTKNNTFALFCNQNDPNKAKLKPGLIKLYRFLKQLLILSCCFILSAFFSSLLKTTIQGLCPGCGTLSSMTSPSVPLLCCEL